MHELSVKGNLGQQRDALTGTVRFKCKESTWEGYDVRQSSRTHFSEHGLKQLGHMYIQQQFLQYVKKMPKSKRMNQAVAANLCTSACNTQRM